ncbi:uncharacterized protein LOC108040536 isoform X2 [Drosophila rhopaloa]|uniref:Uncharacterized protein LOC108040536 isoform X2 n=1 Tax=Drosophila rhopaloa TaxID=1041015 RepID=A0A6P4E6F9_DRORH|nr:uncharacterized protein LOC108040536 isoform X2 [Drosophila rhopaloa]
MLPSVQNNGRPRDRFRNTSTLLLTRNLRFYEFRRKDLLHYIDLRGTLLQKVASQLENYDGPMSPFLPKEEPTDGRLDCSMLQPTDELPLKFGKYVWQQEEIFLLIHCWQVLLILRRPKEYGSNFELVAEHEDVVAFHVVGGPIPYQAVVELKFGNGKRLCCDFQDDSLDEEPSTSEKAELASQNCEALLQKVHAAEAELTTQRMQTQRDLALAQEVLLFGPPAQRSLILEEKQPLRRFGDVWTRICGDYFVCGTLLVNVAGSHRLSIARDLCPVVGLDPPSNFRMEHRLYELPLQPDGQPPLDYDQLAQFWACQDQHSRQLKWRPVSKAGQLPPECSAVMVVRLRLVDLLQAEQLHLLVLYEIKNSAEEEASPRQMHLVTFDVKKLLDATESLAPSFSPATLHQDFLAVMMTQRARCCLKLEFQATEDCGTFEQLLASKLQFELIQAQEAGRDQDSDILDDSCAGAAFQSTSAAADPVQRIFYNRQPLSQWCGVLILRDDPGQLWHVYAQTEDRLRLLQHRLMRDLLQLHCNVNVLEVSDHNQAPADVALELEASLNEELEAWKEVLKPASSHKQRLEQLTHLHRVQMASDVLASMIKSPNDPE